MNGAKKGYDPDESTGGNPLTRLSRTSYVTSQEPVLQIYAYFLLFSMKAPRGMSMSSDFPHYSFRMPNIGFQNLPLNIYIVVFGTAIFVFILSLLFCCYLIRVSPGRNKLNRNNVQQDSAMQQFPTKFTPRHPAISYLAGQMVSRLTNTVFLQFLIPYRTVKIHFLTLMKYHDSILKVKIARFSH
ncbi:RING finger protein 24 isoform X2 [Etheostoma cragini]|uniref:RING finger protein 24 isoform X2 n=1 Tax=Etheostoma cragini TaxID=417921 RepID=UPI00155EDE43|nr:RING finger protein 24 isoform X2 [Etheostoma cragini]